MSKTPRPMNLTEVISAVTPLLEADPALAEPTGIEYLRQFRQFLDYATALGYSTTTDLTAKVVLSWLDSWTLLNQPPAQNTRRRRRSAVRKLFILLRSLGAYASDPLLDSPPISREHKFVRPLTNPEMSLCQLRASKPRPDSAIPATLAIAQAGAASIEVSKVTGEHVDFAKRTLRLLGSSLLVPRTVPLTAWGTRALAERLACVEDETLPLTIRGANDASSRSSVSARLRATLDKAGLSGKPGIELRSIRLWAGLRMFNETGSIETAALVLGVRSLEQAAQVLNYPWRTEAES